MKSLLRISFITIVCSLTSACSSTPSHNSSSQLPPGFVYLSDVAPAIIQEMRYKGDHNFIGKPLAGYFAHECVLTTEAAEQLKKAQDELMNFSMTFKVYDCYRPQKAVNQFVEWAKDQSQTQMKKEFYPKVPKSRLFLDGYIAEKSGHSRGSTVDLTIVQLPVASQETYKKGDRLRNCSLPASKRFKDNSLDFGTGFDCFDVLSHTLSPDITSQQKARRLMIKSLLEKYGFKNLREEWWHYTLINEPFSDQYFDFDIQPKNPSQKNSS